MTVRGSIKVSENDFSKNFDAFLQMQNQYMDMWKTAGQKKPEPSPQNPWASVMNNFCSSMPGQDTSFGPLGSPLGVNMYQQNLMMSQLTKCFESIVSATNNTGEQSPEQWQSFINQSLDDLQSQLMKSGTAPFTSTPDMANLWGMPISLWQQTMQTQNFSVPAGMAASPGADQTTGSAANMGPGLGPNREKYEKLQNLQVLMQAYQAAQKEYSQAFSTFWPEVIEQLKVKINNASESDDDTLSSTNSLHKLWVDVAEDVYGKTTRTDSYQECYSKLLNASMALKKATDEIQQDTLAEFNIPGRKEIDTLSERLQRTRRENRLLRLELDELKIAFANSQIANSQKASAKTKPDPKKAGSKIAKKKVSKKKASKKKIVKKRTSTKKPK
jgi:class III poly(R)-hydroxyalkanoic acid synthase PhaE subunit